MIIIIINAGKRVIKLLSRLFIFIVLRGTSTVSISIVSTSSQIKDADIIEQENSTSESSNPISSATGSPNCSLPHEKRCYPNSSSATDSVSIRDYQAHNNNPQIQKIEC